MNRARAIFDELTTGAGDAERWSRISRLVAEKEAESLWLDFKEVNPTADPRTDNYIKEKLARSLSGFANTEGGVIVYGVVAQGGKKGQPDIAERIAPIRSPAVFRGHLERIVSSLVDPLIGGIAIQEIVDPNTSDGVVIVLVPESTGGPHRVVGASAEANDRYMMRTATEFVVMPHSALADRFSRTAPPLLRMTARFSQLAPATLELLLTNVGRGTARRPAIELVTPTSALQDPPTSNLVSGFVVRKIASNNVRTARYLIEPHTDVVLYPGQERRVHVWETRLSGRLELPFEVRLYTIDTRPVQGSGKLEVDLTQPSMPRVSSITVPPEY